MFYKRKILSVLEKYLDSPESLVLTGFRRVGKTTIIKHLFDELKSDNKIFLDMESPINQRMFRKENYEAILSDFVKLGLNIKEKSYIFIDEIQYAKKSPSIIKYLFDHYSIKFVLTGSSSFYLKNHFSESLSGRKFLFELFPLDFEEFLWFKDEKLSITADHDLLRHLYDEYMEFGGLPAVVLEKDVENKKLRLDDALGSYFQLDVTNLANFHDRKNLESLMFLLASRTGSKLDITKLSQSLGVSRQTLYNYLEFLKETYLINLVPQYSDSSDVVVRKVQKLYFNDSGILNRIEKISQGQIFENTIFNQLYSKNYFNNLGQNLRPRIYYYQKKSGAEIDFISENRGYEVKLTGTAFDVFRMERFSKKLNLEDFNVISLEKSPKENKKIIYPFTI
ncbi:MAG: hypothetical protein ACD_19C00426G0005 [uncultured bacterium]|nr:MAG: hypothetical protein ACD_19C00426G0005 [uncultured bacterium]